MTALFFRSSRKNRTFSLSRCHKRTNVENADHQHTLRRYPSLTHNANRWDMANTNKKYTVSISSVCGRVKALGFRRKSHWHTELIVTAYLTVAQVPVSRLASFGSVWFFSLIANVGLFQCALFPHASAIGDC